MPLYGSFKCYEHMTYLMLVFRDSTHSRIFQFLTFGLKMLKYAKKCYLDYFGLKEIWKKSTLSIFYF